MSLGILPQNTCKERHYAIEKQNCSKYGHTEQEKKNHPNSKTIPRSYFVINQYISDLINHK